jgi:GDP-L-fucose synthase
MVSIVSGGAGFVGRHLIKALLERGDEVICIDPIAELSGGLLPEQGWFYEPRDFPNFKFLKEDCRDWFRNNPTFECDFFFHLAAIVGGRRVIEADPLAVAEDLEIDTAFWRWARTALPRKVICFSSSAAYPLALQAKESYRLLRESDIDFCRYIGAPDITYGWSKLTCEYLANVAFQSVGLKSVVFRPFSGYGPDQSMAYPIPSICRRALLEKGGVLKVWGSGAQMRDFIHIDDCIKRVLFITDLVENAAPVNLSTGIYTSFLDLASRTAALLGHNPVIEGSLGEPVGVFARAGCTQRQEELGIRSMIGLDDGLEDCLKFQESRLG